MAAGEIRAMAKDVRARTQTLGERFDERTVWALRSELFALDAYLRANPKASDAPARRLLDRALRLADATHAFTAEVRGFEGQKEHSERASLFDLGAIGILGIENVLTADKVTLPRILMSSLSEALVYLASRQYVAGSDEVLRALYRQHAATMYRELWTLATDYRKRLTAEDVREVQQGIDAFFVRLEADGVPVEAKVALLRQFYALLLIVRVSELIDALGG